jgi:uncharacterized protein YcnI
MITISQDGGFAMKSLFSIFVVALFCGTSVGRAVAHDTLTSVYAPAGYVQDLEMRVSHGCNGSAVKEVRIKIPEGVLRVTVGYTRDWQVEIKMRKLAKPARGDGGSMISETVDEIAWKNPKSPLPAMGMFEGFKFRAALPNAPGAILFFKTVSVCEQGDDKYIDLPKDALDAGMPDFAVKLGKFMSATPGPAPFVILEKPSRPQYPYVMPAATKPPTH